VTISANGRAVAFASRASNLSAADADDAPDVYVRRAHGRLTLASVAADGSKPAAGLAGVDGLSLSRTGRRVAFSTDAPLDPGDRNGKADVYVKDLRSGRLFLASATADGTAGDESSTDPTLSYDGTSVVFASAASNLDPRDTDTESDIYRMELDTGALSLVSTTAAGEKADGASSRPALSGDGRVVAFASDAPNLGAGPQEEWALDVYVKDLATGAVAAAWRRPADELSGVVSLDPKLPCRGSSVAFVTNATRLSPADANLLADVYLTATGLASGERCLRGCWEVW
jgi:Tol biopolymer transport system component